MAKRISERESLEAEYPRGYGEFMSQASPVMPKSVRELVNRANVSLPSSAPINPQFIDAQIQQVRGFTPTEGTKAGVPYITFGYNALPWTPNVMGHEGFHQRRVLYGNPYLDQPVPQKLHSRMKELQPSAEADRLWGAKATSSNEEAIASIAGYLAARPRGTSLSDSTVGKALFSPQRDGWDSTAQARKDNVFGALSFPEGGLWNGQEEAADPSPLRLAQEKIMRFLTLGNYRQPDTAKEAAEPSLLQHLGVANAVQRLGERLGFADPPRDSLPHRFRTPLPWEYFQGDSTILPRGTEPGSERSLGKAVDTLGFAP